MAHIKLEQARDRPAYLHLLWILTQGTYLQAMLAELTHDDLSAWQVG